MLDRKGRTFVHIAHTQIGKTLLLARLSRFGEVRTCAGPQTQAWREAQGWEKAHVNDAVMTLRTVMEANFEVSVSRTCLIHRPRGVVYVPAC